jgi:hypothetical protein
MASSSAAAAALRVYLGHSLSSTLLLLDKLAEEDDGSHELKRCVAACTVMLRYVRSAQSVCGPLGLAALDRSEEHLRLCMRKLCSPASGKQDNTMYSVAASCYAKAISWQCRGDYVLQELYIFGGQRLDAIARVQPDAPYSLFSVESSLNDCAYMQLQIGKRQALFSHASEAEAQTQDFSRSGKVWSVKRNTRAAHVYRYAAVCSHIAEIHHNGKRAFPTTGTEVIDLMRHQFTGAQMALNVIMNSAFAVYGTADNLHPCAELTALAELAVHRFEQAVTEASARPAAPGDRTAYNVDSQLKYRNMARLVANAIALADLVATLSPVMTQLNSLREKASNSNYQSRSTGNGWDQILTGAADQLTQLVAEITASAASTGHEVVHVQSRERMKASIAEVAAKLQTVQGAAVSWEERAIQRYMAEANKVGRDASPAHAHIAECWLQAAAQMRLAVGASAAASMEDDAKRITKHRACAKEYAKLATGTLRDATTYFAKAANPHATLLATELWREAEGLLVEAGLKHMHRIEGAAAMDVFTTAALTKRSATDDAVLSRATACADCAAAMDGLSGAEVDAALAMLPEVAPTDGPATAVQDDTMTDASYAVLTLAMRLLLVHVDRIPLVDTVEGDSAVGFIDSLSMEVRAIVVDTLLLCQSATAEVMNYPEGHLFHRAAPPTEHTAQRDQLLLGLCSAAVDCFTHYLPLMQPYTPQPGVPLPDDRSYPDMALFDLKLALSAVQGILRHAYHPTEKDLCVTAGRYRTASHEQAQKNFVLFRRHLAACRLAFAEQGLAHELMNFGACPALAGVNLSLPHSVGNAAVERAWKLQPAKCGALDKLIVCNAKENTNEGNVDRLIVVVNALEKLAVHRLATLFNTGEKPQETRLRKEAVKQFKRMVAMGVSIMNDTAPRTAAETQRQHESFTRAARAAEWTAQAVDAFLVGRPDIMDLFERAVQLAVTVETNANNLRRKRGPDDAAQLLGDKAGVRFAEAAAALAAGNVLLYERWVQAAEATAKLVVTTPKGKSSAESKLTFTAAHSEAAVQAADALEALAVALQGGEPKPAADARTEEEVAQPACAWEVLRAAQQTGKNRRTGAGGGKRAAEETVSAAATDSAKRRRGE